MIEYSLSDFSLISGYNFNFLFQSLIREISYSMENLAIKIVCLQMKVDWTIISHYITQSFSSWMVGRICIMSLGLKGLKYCIVHSNYVVAVTSHKTHSLIHDVHLQLSYLITFIHQNEEKIKSWHDRSCHVQVLL